MKSKKLNDEEKDIKMTLLSLTTVFRDFRNIEKVISRSNMGSLWDVIHKKREPVDEDERKAAEDYFKRKKKIIDDAKKRYEKIKGKFTLNDIERLVPEDVGIVLTVLSMIDEDLSDEIEERFG